MKKIGVFRLGLAFGGCFLGAGYVSGQEMRHFYGQYGVTGYFGIVLAVALLCVIGAVTLFFGIRSAAGRAVIVLQAAEVGASSPCPALWHLCRRSAINGSSFRNFGSPFICSAR